MNRRTLSMWGIGGSLPPVPSLVPVYKGYSETATDENVTTLSNLDIGVPHPKRVVVATMMNPGTSTFQTSTLNGIGPYARGGGPSVVLGWETYLYAIPDGEKGELILSTPGSTRKAVCLYVVYPNDPWPLFIAVSGVFTATSNGTQTMLPKKGGCAIFSGGQNAIAGGAPTFSDTDSSGTFTQDKAGADVAGEASSFGAGSIVFTIDNQNANGGGHRITMSCGAVSGNKRLTTVCFGPPYGYTG